MALQNLLSFPGMPVCEKSLYVAPYSQLLFVPMFVQVVLAREISHDLPLLETLFCSLFSDLYLLPSFFFSPPYTAAYDYIVLLLFCLLPLIMSLQATAMAEYIMKGECGKYVADFVEKVTFTCPKCLESLSSNPRSMAHAIYEYHKAAQALNDTEKTLVQNLLNKIILKGASHETK